MKRIRKVVVHVTEKVTPVIAISPIITDARTVGVLSGPDDTFKQALAFALANGTRLFTRAEAQYLFEHDSKFREAVKDTWFWVLESASVNSNSRYYAWLFSGYDGIVLSYGRYLTYGVRCVAGDTVVNK